MVDSADDGGFGRDLDGGGEKGGTKDRSADGGLVEDEVPVKRPESRSAWIVSDPLKGMRKESLRTVRNPRTAYAISCMSILSAVAMGLTILGDGQA